MIIDSHFHLWAPARGDYGWMDSAGAAPIRRDVGPQHYDVHRRIHGIDKAVIVQAAPTTNETDYMLGLADATEWIAKVVGWIDFGDRTQRRYIERWARHPKFSGVRPMIQDLPDADWMHRTDVQWAYDAIIDLDITFDALGFPVHLDNFKRLFDRYPRMRTVIDHCMKPVIRNGAFDDWARKIADIARSTPAFCKLSGLATEAGAGWTAETLTPYAAHVIKVFGPDRVMWGSDWPVLELNGSFESWRQFSRNLLGGGPAAEAILGRTAAEFYRIA